MERTYSFLNNSTGYGDSAPLVGETAPISSAKYMHRAANFYGAGTVSCGQDMDGQPTDKTRLGEIPLHRVRSV